MTSTTPPPRRTRAPRRALSRTSIALGLTVFITLIGTTFATATWTAPTSTVTGTATAAIPALSFTGSAALATEYKFAVAAASPNVIKPLILGNTGTAPLDFVLTVSGVTGNELATKVRLTLWKSANSTCATTVPSTNVTVGSLAEPPVLPPGATSVPAKTSFTLCAATSLTTTVAAAQGLTVTPVLTLTGRIGTNWTTTINGPVFSQSVYRVGEPMRVRCDNSGSTARISWDPASGASVQYRIIRVADGGSSALSTTRNFSITYSDVTSTAFLVQSAEAGFGTTSVGVPVTVLRSGGLLGLFPRAYCG